VSASRLLFTLWVFGVVAVMLMTDPGRCAHRGKEEFDLPVRLAMAALWPGGLVFDAVEESLYGRVDPACLTPEKR
jgi:hypothetical protein